MNHGASLAGAAEARQQPLIQGQVDQAAKIAQKLAMLLAGIDETLDRLSNPTPKPVAGGASDQAGNNAARLTVESKLNIHNADLQRLCGHAEELLVRLNRTV